MNNLILTVAAGGNLVHLLVGFLVLLVVIAIVAGLIYAIEAWVMNKPLPDMVRLVIGLILILLVILWAVQNFMPGSL